MIIGAGPAGIFTALELIRKGSKKSIALVEKGAAIEHRRCPKSVTQKCVTASPAAILPPDFPAPALFPTASCPSPVRWAAICRIWWAPIWCQSTIAYADSIYLEFGADTHVEGVTDGDEIRAIRKARPLPQGLKLVDCPIRHMGTEKAQKIYLGIEKYLAEHGVELLFGMECVNIILQDSICKGVTLTDGKKDLEIYADETVIAAGRRGADWLEKVCAEHNIAHQSGTVDVGVRVEVRNEVMETVNRALYESKLIGYPKPFKNKVRTFCQNPGGFVSQENYDNDLAVVNGHSYKEKKSDNTNLAILCSHNFNEPFNQPIAFCPESWRADLYAGRRPYPGPALRRHS